MFMGALALRYMVHTRTDVHDPLCILAHQMQHSLLITSTAQRADSKVAYDTVKACTGPRRPAFMHAQAVLALALLGTCK